MPLYFILYQPLGSLVITSTFAPLLKVPILAYFVPGPFLTFSLAVVFPVNISLGSSCPELIALNDISFLFAYFSAYEPFSP